MIFSAIGRGKIIAQREKIILPPSKKEMGSRLYNALAKFKKKKRYSVPFGIGRDVRITVSASKRLISGPKRATITSER